MKKVLFIVFSLCTFVLFGNADPIPAPNFSECNNEECCPMSVYEAPILFTHPTQEELPTIRVRRPSHLLTVAEQERLAKAYELMKALPHDDPRSFENQRRLHCSYCTLQIPLPWTDLSTGDFTKMQVHYTWFFLSWHRWFLYFHERILASLLNDTTFALSYWNWDNQDVASLPNAFPTPFVIYESLRDDHRNRNHIRPAIANLSFQEDSLETPPYIPDLQNNTEELRTNNLAVMHLAMVMGSTTRLLFYGQPFRYGDPTITDPLASGQGLIEATMHDSIHTWAGNLYEDGALDMGSIAGSANDPIFFAHHSNIDRLWNTWKSLGDWRQEISDPDYLNSEFLFYNEKAEPVIVKVHQGVDAETQLRYKFEEPPNNGNKKWYEFKPKMCSNFTSSDDRLAWINSIPAYNGTTLQVVWHSPAVLRVARPPRRSETPSNSTVTEVLVFEGIQVDWYKPALIRAFLLYPNASDAERNLGCAEFSGVWGNIANFIPAANRTLCRVGLSLKLDELGANDLDEIVVTIVAGVQHSADNPITIGKAYIEYEVV